MAVVGDTDSYLGWRTFYEVLTPWAYGGLGACVYLLRSAHVFIYREASTFTTSRNISTAFSLARSLAARFSCSWII